MPSDVVLHENSVEVVGSHLTAKNINGTKVRLGPVCQIQVDARNQAGTVINGALVQTRELRAGRKQPPESGVQGQNGAVKVFAANQARETISLEGRTGIVRARRVTEQSDARCKSDIRPLEGSALDRTIALQAVSYRWADEDPSSSSRSDQIGFIAQDVAHVIPEAVSQDDSGFHALSYTSLVPVLAEAIKEQQKLIEQQRELLDQERERAAAIERRLNSLVDKLSVEE